MGCCEHVFLDSQTKMHRQLRHENVIKFIGVCTHPSHLCIVTEICAKGDLFDVIRNYQKPSFAQQVMYMYDIALGVSYLHTRRYIVVLTSKQFIMGTVIHEFIYFFVVELFKKTIYHTSSK